MPYYICATCGAQYPDSAEPPARCVICDEERQYIGWEGQQWTTLEALRETHHTVVKEEEPGLYGIGTEPGFAINQRALLVQAPGGNVLWDCITLIDDAAIEEINKLGGISAIALSHPHYYSSIVEWSRAFGNVPIYLHAADRAFVPRPDPAIHFWEGETLSLGEGLTVLRCGGHFEGSSVLHWAAGAEGRGALFTGDTIYVVSDRRWVTFMYSFPNYIPLPAREVRRVAAAVAPYAYDRIYSAWFGRVMQEDAKAGVARSVERYIRAITD